MTPARTRRRLGRVRLLVALLVATLGAVGSSPAAEIVEREIEHRIGADGAVVETTRMRVVVRSPEDARHWSTFAVPLDENRRLESFAAWVAAPGKREKRIRGRHQDRIEVPEAGVLHDSSSYHYVELPGVEVGSSLRFDYVVRAEPYFPAGAVLLDLADATTELVVRIHGAEDVGFSLEGGEDAEAGLLIEEGPDGLVVRGAPAAVDSSDARVIRYTWGANRTWHDVGRWYSSLLADVPRADPSVAALARDRVSPEAEPRVRLETLLELVHREIDYVAVEVGVGGYRPSSPSETLARGWGDCKDQSLFLIDLLDSVGIPSYPALVRSSLRHAIDPSFQSPTGFNHLIVAVDVAAVTADAADPVADGLLFVDPTQSRGGAAWLQPAVHGQEALVVGRVNARDELVRVPDRSAVEARTAEVRLELHENGSARGGIDLTLTGWDASALIDRLGGEDPGIPLLEEVARLLPGAELADLSWGVAEGPVPKVRIVAAATWPLLTQVGSDRWSLPVPDAPLTPVPAADLALAGQRTLTLTIDPPEAWCPDLPEDIEEQTPGGSLVQRAHWDGESLTLRRDVRLGVDAARGEDWRELAVIEHRELRRRLRFRSCRP